MIERNIALGLGCIMFIAGCKQAVKKDSIIDEKTIVNKALDHGDWKFTSTSNFKMYVLERSYTANYMKTYGEVLEDARTRVLNKLKEKSLGPKPSVFFVDDRVKMKEILGSPAGGWTEVKDNAIFLVQNETTSAPVHHELGHLYSWRNWGPPKALWLSEGVAVFAVGDCAGISLHAWAAALTNDENIVSMTQLENEEFDFSRAAPHLQAGSFVQFIAEEYGIEALKKLWKSGLEGSLEATGRNAEELERSWLQLISQPGHIEQSKSLNTEGKIKCEN